MHISPEDLFSYIQSSPSPYHAAAETCRRLAAAGFSPLREEENWQLTPGQGYYLCRGGSVIAFFLPETAPVGCNIIATHSDSPTFRLKPDAELTAEELIRLNVEPYGGGIYSSWLDRPLSVAGQIAVREENGVSLRLVSIDRDLLVIPSLAIHMNREANKGYAFKPQQDLLPLMGTKAAAGSLSTLIGEAAGIAPEQWLGGDLTLYLRETGRVVGAQDEFLLAPRLDDLACAYAALCGFLSGHPAADRLTVYALFHHEEVGSRSRQGAGSDLLWGTLERIREALTLSQSALRRALANGLLCSADNAHAAHPAHPEAADPQLRPRLNGGVVVKQAANQSYTTDAVSEGLLRVIAEHAGVLLQQFANHSDRPGGSTLGNLLNTRLSMPAVDIGLPQLAMHSACETMGREDFAALVRLSTAFYAADIRRQGERFQVSFPD